jgi:hypothetical protein
MMPRADEQSEVWLRGNLRPVLVIAVAAAGVAAVAGMAAVMTTPPAWVIVAAAAAGGLLLTGLGVLAWAAVQPRLVRQGDSIVVRLAPLRVERVPLEVVECVFRGTEPVIAGEELAPRFRVGTLILRIAERAGEWRERETFRFWGSWDDGHIVIDGRWCEPLSPESARRIATRLAELRRELAAGCPS